MNDLCLLLSVGVANASRTCPIYSERFPYESVRQVTQIGIKSSLTSRSTLTYPCLYERLATVRTWNKCAPLPHKPNHCNKAWMVMRACHLSHKDTSVRWMHIPYRGYFLVPDKPYECRPSINTIELTPVMGVYISMLPLTHHW